MKTFFTLLFLTVFALAASAQQSWLKGHGNIGLYVPSDKVSIGPAVLLDGKLVIQSNAGESTLSLKGDSSQVSPFISLGYSTGLPIWKLFASADWWCIGNIFDSTKVVLAVNPLKSWIRFNATCKFTKVISPAITADSVTINKFFKLPPQTTAPAAVFGNVYMKASDSCIYYYNGTAWKKISVQ